VDWLLIPATALKVALHEFLTVIRTLPASSDFPSGRQKFCRQFAPISNKTVSVVKTVPRLTALS
jgi:hypothetical protein